MSGTVSNCASDDNCAYNFRSLEQDDKDGIDASFNQ